MNKKVITFCVYGTRGKYTLGIIKAVESAIKYYDDWEIWVYVCNNGELCVPKVTITNLNRLKCKIIFYEDYSSNASCEGMFRRFSLFNDETVDYWISRDADSRCTLREKKMVDEWIDSKKTIHTILDHGCHKDVMGGTVGVCNINLREKYPEKLVDIDNYLYNLIIVDKKQLKNYNNDQDWLRKHLKDIIINNNDLMVHVPEKFAGSRCIYGKVPIKSNFSYIITENCSDFVGKIHK